MFLHLFEYVFRVAKKGMELAIKFGAKMFWKVFKAGVIAFRDGAKGNAEIGRWIWETLTLPARAAMWAPEALVDPQKKANEIRQMFNVKPVDVK